MIVAGFSGCHQNDNVKPKTAAPKEYIAQDVSQDQMGNEGMPVQQQRMNIGRTDEDFRILSEIRHQLETQGGLSTDTSKIQVIVNSGTVTLRGRASSSSDKLQIESCVRSVNGVRQVNSQLIVGQ